MRPTKLTQQHEAQSASETKSTDDNVEYFTWEEFKDFFDLKKAEVVKNPNTGKLFVASGKHRWKCQADINFELPMRFLVKNEDYDNSCLVNIKET